MGNWRLVACLSVVGVGVLAFLRIVSNEIDMVEKEADYLRRREMSKKRPASDDVVTLESAA